MIVWKSKQHMAEIEEKMEAEEGVESGNRSKAPESNSSDNKRLGISL